MRVLIVGSGAREHAIAWKVGQSPLVDQIYCAPGNGGCPTVARNVPLAAEDIDGLLGWAMGKAIDLTIVGPEDPLAAGIVNRFQEKGLAIFGPTRQAAMIETSKAWAKELMVRYGIPTARSAIFSRPEEAKAYIRHHPVPIVVKASGLTKGKGVTVATTHDEAYAAVAQAMEKRVFGTAGDTVLIEECLSGQEVSVLAFSDGETVVPMVPACDYKRVFDGDVGPNTGGMGGYSPPGFVSRELLEEIQRTILDPTVKALGKEGRPYVGVLYAGLIIAADGPKVLEFNARFGDPETQVILPRLQSDLLPVILAAVAGQLKSQEVLWRDGTCCGVVLASGGYPGSYKTGYPISGLDGLEEGVYVFHAGTKLADGNVVTSGGRVLTVVATGSHLAEAREVVYRNVARVRFQGCHYRTDIAAREVR